MKKIFTFLKYIYYYLQVYKKITKEIMPDDAVYFCCTVRHKKEYLFIGYFNTKKAAMFAVKRFSRNFAKEKI